MVLRQVSPAVLDPRQRVGALPSPPQPVTVAGRALRPVGAARVYVCGITPYDVTHLGHAATFVWADVLAAVLESTGVGVLSSRNITDVDDVLTRAARERGSYFDELALRQESLFERSMAALRVATPSHQPRARHHVAAVQQLAQALLASGAAYERDGTVWFRGAGVAERSGLRREEALRLSADYGDAPEDPAKDDPFDVPVWRSSDDDHPAWASPWGWGRPGWHAECAAMALAVHGSSVDVLVGGVDLAFPHHAYQAAMAATAVEDPAGAFARSTLHVGEVRIDGEKMAKSTGNLVLVDDVLSEAAPAALRMLLLDRPWGEAWDYEPGLLTGAQQRLERLYAAAGRPGEAGSGRDDALAPLREDLDVPAALDLTERLGGEAARRLLTVLRLG